MFSVCELETQRSSALPLQPWFPTSGRLTPVSERKRPQLQLRYSYPRRADARRSWECAFVHRTNRFFADKCSPCTKSGGRKPPVGYKTPLQIATAFLQQSARGQPGAADVSQPWFEKRACSGNTAIVAQRRPVGGLCTDTLATALPDPRRADARRSWECAFVHRTNRFFADKRSQLNTRAGGRKPPVGCSRYANLKRRDPARCRCQRGFRPARSRRVSLDESVRNCNCVTHTHGGLTPAALAGTFASRRTVLDFCDSQLYHAPRRADTRRSCWADLDSQLTLPPIQ
jgi:hypothetical protein